MIPEIYTCDGADLNPPLAISDVPKEAESLAIIVDDPDAPGGLYTHWTIWNIDPDTIEILKNTVPSGSIQGRTSFGRVGYGGPCPPSGTHHYHFHLFALDKKLDLPPGASRTDLENELDEHTIKVAELTGLYKSKIEIEK